MARSLPASAGCAPRSCSAGTTIPVTVVDLDAVVRGEFAENAVRKDFTPSEAVAIKRALEPIEREAAKERQRAGDKHRRNSPQVQTAARSTRSPRRRGNDRDARWRRPRPSWMPPRPSPRSSASCSRHGPHRPRERRLPAAEDRQAGRTDPRRAAAAAGQRAYRVIVVDPPWPYEKRDEDPSHRGVLPYPTMSIAEICAMPVSDIAHADCILWLWTTNHHMREAFAVLDAWGFEPKTILTWAKDRMGTGDWLRGPDRARHHGRARQADRHAHESDDAAARADARTLREAGRVLRPRGVALPGAALRRPVLALPHNDKWDCHGDEAPQAYDASDDFAKSYDDCLREVRERKADGGPGWEPGHWPLPTMKSESTDRRVRHENGSFPPLARAAELLGGDVQGDQILCPGPGHSDGDRSLSVKPRTARPKGSSSIALRATTGNVCRELARKKLGLPEPKHAKQKNGGGKPWTFIAEYIYPDANGAPYLLVKKFIDGDGKKQFPQYHWDGAKWVKGKPRGPKVPYRLRELLAAALTTTVYCCEGEKDADALAAQGFVATTASEGAGAKWDDALTPFFKDRRVVILADADSPGRKHARKVAKALAGVAASVKLVDLYPERDDGSDVSNFLETDKVAAKFIKIVNDAPAWDADQSETKDETKDETADETADENLIAELAALSKLQYAKRRKQVAKRLGIGAGELDKLVAEARGDDPKPESKESWSVDQWPDDVATADLLDDLATIYARHVILPEHGATALALWTLHAWALDAAFCSPLLMLVSPEPRCGKSTCLKVLFWTCPRTVLASNVSGPAIFRYIENHTPTLLLDEAETYVAENEAVRGIINSGHDRFTAIVIRQSGETHEETKEFSTWAPKAIASIGKLAATLRDRAIILPMKRKKRHEQVAKLRGRDNDAFRIIRERAQRWANDNIEALKDARPSLPDLNDRAADNWELPLAIADLAGGDWPAKARLAAVSLSGDADAKAETIGVQLLAAIKAIFEALGTDRITSEDLAERLARDKDSPWAAYGKGARPISQRQIATLLERYGVHPDSIRIRPGTKKGYLFAWLADAFETYLPAFPSTSPFDPEQGDNPTATDTSSAFSSGTGVGVFRTENSEKPNNDGPCDAVPDQNPPLAENEKNDGFCPSQPCSSSIANEASPCEGDDAFDIPLALRRCNRCGRPATATDPLNPYDWPGVPAGVVLLHARCEAPWFDSRGAS